MAQLLLYCLSIVWLAPAFAAPSPPRSIEKATATPVAFSGDIRQELVALRAIRDKVQTEGTENAIAVDLHAHMAPFPNLFCQGKQAINVHDEGMILFRSLPKHKQKSYQEAYAFEAQKALEVAVKNMSLKEVSDVAYHFRNTPAGREALELAVVLFMDRGLAPLALIYAEALMADVGLENLSAGLLATLTQVYLSVGWKKVADQFQALTKKQESTLRENNPDFRAEDIRAVSQTISDDSEAPYWLPDTFLNIAFANDPELRDVYVGTMRLAPVKLMEKIFVGFNNFLSNTTNRPEDISIACAAADPVGALSDATNSPLNYRGLQLAEVVGNKRVPLLLQMPRYVDTDIANISVQKICEHVYEDETLVLSLSKMYAADDRSTIRGSIIECLKRERSITAKVLLANLAKQSDAEKAVSLEFLGEMGDSAVPAIPNMVQIFKASSETLDTRIEAAKALGKLGPRSLAPMLTLLQDSEFKNGDTDGQLRKNFLGYFRDKIANDNTDLDECLVGYFLNPEAPTALRVEALETYRKISDRMLDETTTIRLLTILQTADEDFSVKTKILEELALISNSRQVIPALVAALNDDSESTRHSAALGFVLGSTRTRPYLEALLMHGSDRARLAMLTFHFEAYYFTPPDEKNLLRLIVNAEENPHIRSTAILVYAQHHHPRDYLPMLTQFLSDEQVAPAVTRVVYNNYLPDIAIILINELNTTRDAIVAHRMLDILESMGEKAVPFLPSIDEHQMLLQDDLGIVERVKLLKENLSVAP